MIDSKNGSPHDTEATLAEIRKRLEGQTGQTYWRSLDELADTAVFREFLDKEFPRQAAPLAGSLDRRDFIKLLGASLALAGLSACARPPLPNEKIVPYVQQPEEIVPGKPLHFATAITHQGYAEGLIAESHQGRPTTVAGNPDHPASLGATDATTQATVLTLYDPDRSKIVLERGGESSFAAAATALQDALAGLDAGRGFALLTETVTSPTLAGQISQLLDRYPGARWYQYDPLHDDHAVEGAQLAFGRPLQTVYDVGAADVVVSLDADFTHRGVGRLRYAKDFARRRRIRTADDSMNRLYQLEASPSPTGMIADHRLPLAPAAIAVFATALAHELGVAGAAETPLPDGVSAEFLEAVVADLQDHQGASLVIAGASQPAEVHALVHAVNAALGNVGATVRYHEPVEARPENHAASIVALGEAIRAGEVEALVIVGGNPVYTAPADVAFAAALEQVPLSLHLGLYYDETAQRSSWHVPQTHYLEAWGDARAFDGSVTIQQPLIRPFYGGRSEYELLAALLGDAEASGHDLIRDAWRARVDGDFEAFWRASVYRGVIEGSASPVVEAELQTVSVDAPEVPELSLVFAPDPSIHDGRWANNGWLLELPKPVSKLSWDNAAFVAPSTAETLGVRNGDLLTLDVDGRSVEVPAWIHPGQARNAITVQLGFGRSLAGRVGSGVGVDVYPLRSSDAMWHAPLDAAAAGGRHELVTTQVHHSLNGTGERRHIVRTGTLEAFRAHPDHPEFVHPVEHHESDLYPEYLYESYAWGMVIDMTVCTGCNACVSACQAENNIPIVGKDQVAIGREMHWIRVDNYYRGDLDDPEFFMQPMACQHCEQAPCEPVCPVGATVHDHEGLNVMVYNRCVGTRYCSNNCPYKVRRFNFLQYAELTTTATEQSLVNNPDVTVRSRGVMEKCTYCTQRIAQARITANNEGRAIRDGEVVTACQGACPTEAIVFGDTNDPDSIVTRTKGSPLNFALLEELNTHPRTTYLAKVTNPNPALAGGETGAH